MKALETDDALKAKVKEAFESTKTKTEEAKITLLTKLATENGYNVSTEDFAKHQANGHELDEDELGLVSGGGESKWDEWCMHDYACAWTWMCPQLMLS